jgi:hypothetical protein
MPFPIDRALQRHNARQQQPKSQPDSSNAPLAENAGSGVSNLSYEIQSDLDNLSDDDSDDYGDEDSDRTRFSTPEETLKPGALRKREREIAYALASTHRNLTRMSQYLLKLEARANTATKLHIRKTLDTTVQDSYYASKDDTEPGHKKLIEDINNLSQGVWERLFSVDKQFRRLSRENRDVNGLSTPFELQGESYVKRWAEWEIKAIQLRNEESCFYTVADMGTSRGFRDWVIYLQELFQMGDNPAEELRLVQAAWHFLDRSIRGPRPENPTTINDFVQDWESMRCSGAFRDAVADPKRQERDDQELMKALQTIWSSRMLP